MAADKVTLRSGDALLIIDCINDLDFTSGEKVLPWALKLAPKVVGYRSKMHEAKLPVIYANDNFGLWKGEFTDVYRHCTRAGMLGREVSKKLKPTSKDYFILKPRHSAFFSTALTPLLEHLKVKRLILVGMATNLCVLFSAHDAHMHGYPLVVLSDCCAAQSDFDHNTALSQLKQFCGATVCLSTEVKFPKKKAK